MTYTVVSPSGEKDYRTLREASIAFGRLATSRHEAVLLGPDRLDGTRETIASYSPPPETMAGGAERRAPQKGSAVAYWYAIGWIDSTSAGDWLRDSHAIQFSVSCYGVGPSMLRGRWVEFLEDNAPTT